MIVRASNGSGGGGNVVISWGVDNCYNSPKTYPCNNAMFFVGNVFGPESAMAAGYVNDGVLTKTKEESGLASITYTSGNLVLSESYSSVYGKVYIMYQ